MFKPLQNYVRAHRMKVGLTQSELSLLMGVESRSTVSRIENYLLLPNLEHLLALEIVLGLPAQELFVGVSERIRDEIKGRARALLESLDDRPTKETALKFELLSKLARPDDSVVVPLWEDED